MPIGVRNGPICGISDSFRINAKPRWVWQNRANQQVNRTGSRHWPQMRSENSTSFWARYNKCTLIKNNFVITFWFAVVIWAKWKSRFFLVNMIRHWTEISHTILFAIRYAWELETQQEKPKRSDWGTNTQFERVKKRIRMAQHAALIKSALFKIQYSLTINEFGKK